MHTCHVACLGVDGMRLSMAVCLLHYWRYPIGQQVETRTIPNGPQSPLFEDSRNGIIPRLAHRRTEAFTLLLQRIGWWWQILREASTMLSTRVLANLIICY
jgi:hypothetical protein